MSSVAGFYHGTADFTEEEGSCYQVLQTMKSKNFPEGENVRSGSENRGILKSHAGFIETGTWISQTGLWYDGSVFNLSELKEELLQNQCDCRNRNTEEILLQAYLAWGPDFVKKINGTFSMAVFDEKENRLLLYRDRLGVKPLFYTVHEEKVFFASRIRALLSCPGIRAQIDRGGLNEIFSLGPARTPGCGVFKNIKEVLPGHMLLCTPYGQRQEKYWKLESHPHEDSWEKTVEYTSFLLHDAVKRQFCMDAGACTLLSGGVDSSIVSAICAQELEKKHQKLDTYSFDFKGNEKNFCANAFQPSRDRPFVEKMVAFLDSRHHFLECSSEKQAKLLEESVKAHDLPAMADVDSSLLYFCSQVSKGHKVAMTGECADEIFGGYPWFHKAECLKADTFPWTMDLTPRKALLSEEFLADLHMEEYVNNAYETSLSQVSKLEGEKPEAARIREISWLNLHWFMQTLLNRMERASTRYGLDARVPFADYRIVEYVFNVPWEMKAKNGVAKGLLREASRGSLPEEVLFRKKSPYPKTYDRAYEELLAKWVKELLLDASSPVRDFLDIKKTERFLKAPSDYGAPWYGQLMAAPQLLAYLLQIHYWLKEYQIEIVW